MNKRHGMMAVLLVALLLATSCSTFFTGSVTGKVMYKDKGVGEAQVAVYFDEGQCNADLANYKNTGHFNTKYVARTSANQANLGDFQISNIPWDSCFPEYGKDADEQTIYVLFYHDDFGIHKYEAAASIVSGRNNVLTLEFPEKIVDRDATLTISFQNPKTHRGTTGITSFKYKYVGHPSEEDNEEFVSKTITVPATGEITIPVPYFNNDGKVRPDITIFDMKSSERIDNKPVYKVVEKNGSSGYAAKDEIKVTATDDDHVIIDVVPQIVRFNGFSGRIYVNKYSDEDITVELLNADGDKVAEVVAKEGKSDNIESCYYSYEGLGMNEVIIDNPSFDPEFSAEYKLVVKEGSTPTQKRERTVHIKATPSTGDYTQNFNLTIA